MAPIPSQPNANGRSAALSGNGCRIIEGLGATAPNVLAAAGHVRAFWLETVAAADLRGFVVGLVRDEYAARAAIAGTGATTRKLPPSTVASTTNH